jgi:hypothetical protein
MGNGFRAGELWLIVWQGVLGGLGAMRRLLARMRRRTLSSELQPTASGAFDSALRGMLCAACAALCWGVS